MNEELMLEFSKPEYVDISNADRLSLVKSKTIQKLGWIEEGNLKRLEAIVAKGLWRDKMSDMKIAAKAVLDNPASTVPEKSLATAKLTVVAGFHEAISEAKLANKAPRSVGGHSVNLNDVEVYSTFIYAKALGLITQDEVTQVEALATYDKQLFPDATIKDVISYFNPELISDVWYETDFTTSNYINFKLNSNAPTNCHVLFEMQEQYDDDSLSEWFRATSLHNVFASRSYRVNIPYNGYRRRLRWKCEYNLDCVVSV